MNAYSIAAISSILISFLVTIVLGKVLIPFIKRLKYGQKILEIGPSWHKNKEGTPTMGGIMFIVGITVATLISIPLYYKISAYMGVGAYETPLMMTKIFAGLGMAIACGLIGMIDDMVKIRHKENAGLTPKQKLILQFSVVGFYFLCIYTVNKLCGGYTLTTVNIPFWGNWDLLIFYWPIIAVIMVGIINAANLSDGIDGLGGSVAFFIALFLMIIAGIKGMFGMGIEACALAGGCLGFLFWNVHPAKIFMGDTGSLFLGGIICALGIGMGIHIPLIILSFVYIFEMFSVILQVLYFKFTHGKRLFKMSPIHHHFEMCGWKESKICIVFSLATIVLGTISALLIIYAM